MQAVLLVEDSELIALDLAFSLETSGFKVLGPAKSLSEAREILNANESIACAILDIHLEDNEKVFPLVPELESRGIPMVFLSGRDKEALLPANLKNYRAFQKPVVFEELLEGIKMYLGDS